MSVKKEWSRQEIELLRQLYAEGHGLHAIAEQLKRSYSSVKSEAQRLGLRREGGGQAVAWRLEKPVKMEKPLSRGELFRLTAGVLKRLQEPGLTQQELKYLETVTKAINIYSRITEGWSGTLTKELEMER